MQKLKSIFPNRIIGEITNGDSLPTIIAFGGIHGNEKAGVKALENVVNTIENNTIDLKGNLYAIKGNIKALSLNARFIDKDLNRVWTKESIELILSSKEESFHEASELIELLEIIKKILSFHNGQFYFLDLHTTSSSTVPFITISDSLNNRKFASYFKKPIVLGIEEYLEGPLLTYMNEFGYISLGFEAGQHNHESSVIHCINFIWKALLKSKCITRKTWKLYRKHRSKGAGSRFVKFYHILYKYGIREDEHFLMKKGYHNFHSIKEGEELGFSDGKLITSPIKGDIFMPLYQDQGDDGFFVIHKVSKFWLIFSKFLRRINAHALLRILPGIKKENEYTLQVDPKVVRFLANDIFHLFGYRKKVKKGDFWYFIKRDRKIIPMN